VHTKFEFDFETTATPEQVVELMTDFSPNRPHRWPASSVKAFEVYRRGGDRRRYPRGPGLPEALGHLALRLVDTRLGDPVDYR